MEVLKLLKFLLFSVLVTGINATACSSSVLKDLTFHINGGSLDWPCSSTKSIYTESGRYIPKNVLSTRAQIYRDEAFVTLPRLKSGVPFTLGKVSLRRGQCFLSVAPYPCWDLQQEGNCQAIQSAVDLFLDPYDILWVLDVGIVNTLEQAVRRCPPKVVGINVRTGKVVQSIDLSTLVVKKSKLQHLVVEYNETGHGFIYIADAGSRSIIVWDMSKSKGVRVVLPGACSNSKVNSDVLYILLVQKSSGKYLYFTFLKSTRLFAIKTEHLREGAGAGAVVDIGPKPSGLQIVLLGTDNRSGVFFRYKGQSDIYMWDAETCFKAGNFIEVQRGGDCRLATQVMPGFRRHMWTIESNFQDFIADNVGCSGPSVVIHPVVKNE